MNLRKLILSLFVTAFLLSFPAAVFAQQKVFTVQELATYNGKDGAKAYTSYQGKVYDVTDSKLWKLGEHFGLQAGIDLTDEMANAPHGPEVFAGFTQIGVLEGWEEPQTTTTSTTLPTVAKATEVPNVEQTEQKKWYQSRLELWDISILGWTGILLGVFFVLTFATCFAMPWAQLRLPWTGTRPGPDPLDASATHQTWSALHKHFVWITVILGIVHGILGFLQMFGIYL